jgi:hypothetical protein
MPVLRPAQQQDPDLGHARGVPGKNAARLMLTHWLARRASPVVAAPGPSGEGGAGDGGTETSPGG